MTKKIFLSIAASDSIGGAGIQADNRTAVLLGFYPVNVVTAVTAQNSSGVSDIQEVSEKMLRAQFEAVMQDFKPDCVKIGLLPSSVCAKIVAELIGSHRLENVVLDPVLSATMGGKINSENIGKDIVNHFGNIVSLITPNLPESEKLTLELGAPLQSVFNNVLIKGGHSEKNTSDDLLITNYGELIFEGERIATKNTHGSGCVLSSAIACYLAENYRMTEAVKLAKQFVQSQLLKNRDVSFGQSGYGPVIY